jgi:predicted nucleic acid-binding protein
MDPVMTEYLIDTNILIYYLAGALTPEEKTHCRQNTAGLF